MPVQTQKEVWVRTGQPRYRWFVIFRGGTSRFGCLRGLLCGTSAPVRGWVIESGSLAGNVSVSASSRFASSSAFCALVLAFLFMGTPPVRHSTINRKLPSAGGIIPPFLSCENAPFYYQQVSPLDAPAIRICALLLSGQAPE